MKRILGSFVGNTVFANITFVIILISGCFSVVWMVRETFPEFSLDIITVSIPYPGASPDEVEEGISRKVEESIESIEGIERYSSFSREGLCLLNIEVERGYKVSEVLETLRTKIGSISTFPSGSENPIIEELIFRDPVLFLYISGDVSSKAIKELAHQTRDEIQRLSEVSQVKIFGDREYEISVQISKENLEKYNTTCLDIADIIRKNNLNLDGGKITGSKEESNIKVLGRRYTGEDLSSLLVLADKTGGSVPLDKIADVNDGFVDDFVEANINGKIAAIITVYKTKGEDSLAISRAVDHYLEMKRCNLSGNLNIGVLYDNTEMLQSRINLLFKNGFLGLGIVFLFLWLFLNIRLSFWTGMGMLVSISGALLILFLMGETINMVSLFGLIMVLGIVVDDAIVVGEAIYFNRNQGKTAFDSAVSGVREVGLPVLVAVTTTIVAFVPLLYVGGIMGKFISILPVVVVTCLLVSLFESLFILPAHLNNLPNPDNGLSHSNYMISKIENVRRLFIGKLDWFINNTYVFLLGRVLEWRYVFVSSLVAIFLLFLGLFQGGFLKFQVFPPVDGFVITSTIEFPEGTSVSITKAAVERIDNAIENLSRRIQTSSGDNLIKSRFSLVGETLEQIPRTGSNLGSVQVILLESDKRGFHSDKVMALWEKEIGDIVKAEAITFEGLSTGPPGEPIEVWIQGNDIDVLSEVGRNLVCQLNKFSGLYQIHSDFSRGKTKINLKLKPEGRYLGLTVADLAQQIRATYYGSEVLELQRGRNNVKIKVRSTEGDRDQINDIEKMKIKTFNGNLVPLNVVAEVSFIYGPSCISRVDGMQKISVTAKVNTDITNTEKVIRELSDNFFPELSTKYPQILISPQGEQKKTKESLESLSIGFPMAIMGIFIILATTFRSYLQPIIIIFTIPFGVIGAVLGHVLLRYDLSIMSVFGMVALTGIVINAAIILIDQINKNLISNMSLFEAVIKGSSRRFLAIFLTTVSTSGGLMPMILEKDLQAKFLIPMAVSIAFGVVVASVLTLLAVPCFFIILSDIRILFNRLKSGIWEKRELLEPAYNRQEKS